MTKKDLETELNKSVIKSNKLADFQSFHKVCLALCFLGTILVTHSRFENLSKALTKSQDYGMYKQNVLFLV